MTTNEVIASITSALEQRVHDRIRSERDRFAAQNIAGDALRPYVPDGVWHWLRSPWSGERRAAYARRVVMCMIARCAEAGVICPLKHGGAETLGMLAGHIGADATESVSCIEKSMTP